MTGTLTLAEFLLARIAEDEKRARDCAKVYPASWDVYDRGHSAKVQADGPHFRHVADLDQDQVQQGTVDWLSEALDHIGSWDPARVLAECEANRRTVDLHRPDPDPQYDNGHGSIYDEGGRFLGKRDDLCEADGEETPCLTLRLRALPYAGHPDYREEWRP